MNVDSLFTEFWGGAAQFSPNNSKILITGNQGIFNKSSVTTSTEQIPNMYNNQAFIYNLATKQADPITKNLIRKFNQHIGKITHGNIYFKTTDKSFKNIYKYNFDSKKFEKINLSADVV